MKLGHFLFEHVITGTEIMLVKKGVILFDGKMDEDEWLKLTINYGDETIKNYHIDIDEVVIYI